ncbi:citrate synthase/methylcitrate synthase [Pseudonocardia ailaonensis]|uniref:Citrate synthase n=1 Tax=Pseudonocardia ailaonensis TaxID=367279 RepID=A0ABN2MPP5_9PSEU
MTGPVTVPAGLRNVVVTSTELGDVRGDEGFYHYRQYSAVDLARTRGFTDVAALMIDGALPDGPGFAAEIAPLRVLPAAVRDVLPAIAAAGGSPLAGLRTALSLTGAALGLAPLWDADPGTRRADALRICALTPTILAALYRLRHGLAPVDPDPRRSPAEEWLHMVTGAEPLPEHVRAVERYLVATVDHGFNASTFTARVVASTGADLAAAVVAAIGAFSGPLHGGAPDRALAALDEIGSPDPVRIDSWVREKVLAGDRIMGFGHAVYRTEDPRARLLRETALELGGDLATFALAVEERVVAVLAELKPERKLYANVEFYAGVVMERCGLPREMFTPTFAVSRVVGWAANILEQAGERRIIRPAARYVGPVPPQPVPA